MTMQWSGILSKYGIPVGNNVSPPVRKPNFKEDLMVNHGIYNIPSKKEIPKTPPPRGATYVAAEFSPSSYDACRHGFMDVLDERHDRYLPGSRRISPRRLFVKKFHLQRMRI